MANPYVLITVVGGVAEVARNLGAEVDILDFDNLAADDNLTLADLTPRERQYILETDIALFSKLSDRTDKILAECKTLLDQAHDSHIFAHGDPHPADCAYCRLSKRIQSLLPPAPEVSR